LQVKLSRNHIDFIIHRHYNVKSRQGTCPCLMTNLILFRSSSVVELSAVNRSVVGSSPTCGAIFLWGSTQEAEEAPLLRV
jgi:hypothetical protein